VRARRALLAGRIERFLGRSGEALTREAATILGANGDPYMSMLAQLDLASLCIPQEAAELCARVQQMAEGIEFGGIALKARVQRARHLLRAGDPRLAASALRQTLDEFPGTQPADMYVPEMWQITCEIHDAAGEHEAAAATLERAARWILDVADQRVPEEFRDSFLNRNPINRTLLRAAQRRGIAAAGR
jgi:hypothetical protein